MVIRKKTLLIFTVMTVITLIISGGLINYILMSAVEKNEQQQVRTELERAVNSVEYDLSTVTAFLTDWAIWDDTYKYVQGQNEDYVKNNLADATFSSQRINIMIFADYQGQILYGKAYDLDKNAEVKIATAPFQPIINSVLPTAGVPLVSGIAALPAGPILVAAMPVVDSLKQKPAQGVMLIGRYLNSSELQRLSKITKLPIQITTYNPEQFPADQLEKQDSLVKIVNSNTVAAIKLLKDINGSQRLVLKIETPRLLYQQGLSSAIIVAVSLLIVTLLYGFSLFILLDRHIVNRIIKLMTKVDSIKSFADIVDVATIGGSDEITTLAEKTNTMLNDLKLSHDRLKYLSNHDALTGVYNRTYFEQFLQDNDLKDYEPVGVIMCDIDGLKLANDMIGHDYGDRMLIQAVQVLRSACPPDSLIARIGGDEFIVIIKNPGEPLAAVCQRISNNISSFEATSAPNAVPLSISLGYACSNSNSIQELVKSADDFMYREKLHRGQSTRSSLVQTLKGALEARDYITDGHAGRLIDMISVLARRIGYPEHKIPDLQLFAEFHDVGKIGIPDYVLFKQGPLTAEEKEKMNKHPEIGYRIAQTTPDLLPIADLILRHHEWWDGNGYPLGLSGTEIPIECRMLAIVDAYDAMLNDRPYRKAMTRQEAIAELLENAGTQFDAFLVAEFIKTIKA